MMTGARFVDLANALATMTFDTRAAVLTALKDPTPDTIRRALAASPEYVGRFAALLLEGAALPAEESDLWYVALAGDEHICDCSHFVYQPGRQTCLKCNGTRADAAE